MWSTAKDIRLKRVGRNNKQTGCGLVAPPDHIENGVAERPLKTGVLDTAPGVK